VLAVSAENHALNGVCMASESTNLAPRRQIPQPYLLVGTSRGKVPAIGAEGHRPTAPYPRRADGLGVTAEGTNLPEGSRVPDDHAPLRGRRNEVPAVATVRETADPLVVSLERAEFLASAQVPDVYGIQSTGSKIPAVGTERNAPNGAGMFQRGEAAVAL